MAQSDLNLQSQVQPANQVKDAIAGVAQTGQLAFNGPSQPSIPATTTVGRYGYAIKNPATVVTAQPPPAPVDELAASDQPYSTFSLHVSDVSFLLASAQLASGQMPDPDSIRPEEFYNAFDYGDPAPATGEKIACHIEQAAHPILQQRNLVRIAMKVAATGRDGGQPLRLTVLLDTSGSMEREDRAASVQRAMQVLTSLLGPNDAVTLIGFARQPRLLAEELPGDQAGKLVDIVKHTPPEGGTNMEEAIKTASELALRHFEKGGQNRVVMLTDGAANLGDADPVQLSKLVDALRQQGVSFDACGVGADGLNDDILEALTRKGGGRYYFLNQPGDADAGFARQLAGAFRPAAENVKMQVRFNPDRVGKYKLIGFEKNRLNQEDFRNDNVTAAQLAAEEAAVALYQVQVLPEGEGEIGEVFVRFRDPADGRMIEQSWTIPYDPLAPALDKASPSMQLATAASLVAEKLRGGPLADAIDMDALEPVVTSLRGYYAQQTRVQDFATMFEQARRMTARK
jgi:Mg-chelatase subunit ChlD